MSNDDDFSPVPDADDLLVPPHILVLLMEMLAGDADALVAGRAHAQVIAAHLAGCPACRAAVLVLLSTSQEADRQQGRDLAPVRALLARFTTIEAAIATAEAHLFERLAVYAEAVVRGEGKEEEGAARRFTALAAHLAQCAECREAVERTVAFLRESQEGDH